MGFTFSHPALVVPFKYLPVGLYSISGLIAGSIVPDFEYFIRLNNISKYSHTLLGLFWFDLPLSVLLLFIFHRLIRDTLINNLPQALYARLSRFRGFDWGAHFKQHWAIVLTSILLGAISHLVWDSFTSENGFFVEKHGFFMQAIEWRGHGILMYQIFKHGSSVLGGLIVIYQIYNLPKAIPDERRRNKNYWLVFSVLLICILLLQAAGGTVPANLSSLIKKMIAGMLAALLLTALACRTPLLPEREKPV